MNQNLAAASRVESALHRGGPHSVRPTLRWFDSQDGSIGRPVVWIGTSGWSYKGWRGDFYPDDLAAKNWLRWYEPAILDLLRDHDMALCLSDHHDAPAPWETTARHVYIRGHGPTGRYRDRYPKKTLDRWAEAITGWRRRRMTVYCYFDNDQKTAAPKDAERLIDLRR